MSGELKRKVAGGAGRKGGLICLHYMQGRCTYGSSCTFSHDHSRLRPSFLRMWAERVGAGVRDRPAAEQADLDTYGHFLSGRGLSVYPWSAGDKAEVESHASRFRVMSYNILGGDLAQEHRYLYNSVPHALLDWNRRWGSIAREIRHLRPDVVCCQEVEAFEEAFRDMAAMGYQGCYLRRGQSRGDGCATFWRKGRFAAVERRAIQYELMGLKDNAALVVVLRSVGGTCAHDLVVGNTHVLFNPKRGDIKVGQVRELMSLVSQLRAEHGGCPAMVMGDFNSTPGSAVHHFAGEGRLALAGLSRRTMSGQVERQGWPWGVTNVLRPLVQHIRQGGGPSYASPPPQPPPRSPHPHQSHHRVREVVPVYGAGAGQSRSGTPGSPYPGPDGPASWADGSWGARGAGVGPAGEWRLHRAEWDGGGVMGGGGAHSALLHAVGTGAGVGLAAPWGSPLSGDWAAEHVESACGAGAEEAGVAEHPLRVASTYSAVLGEEPLYTSCHAQFIGTVDYLWATLEPGDRVTDANVRQGDRGGGGAGVGGTGGSQGRQGHRKSGPRTPERVSPGPEHDAGIVCSGGAEAEAGTSVQAGRPGRGPAVLRPLRVLLPPPLESLECGLPNTVWGSDHISLVCDFEVVWPQGGGG